MSNNQGNYEGKWELSDFDGISARYINSENAQDAFQLEVLYAKDSFLNQDHLEYNDSEGLTPLCFAAMNGLDKSVIQALLCAGANANIACNKGKTPLQYACMSMSSGAIEALTEKEVILNHCDYDGYEIYYTEYNDGDLSTIYETEACDVSRNAASITPDDIISASSLPNESLLKLLLDLYIPPKTIKITTQDSEDNIFLKIGLKEEFVPLSTCVINAEVVGNKIHLDTTPHIGDVDDSYNETLSLSDLLNLSNEHHYVAKAYSYSLQNNNNYEYVEHVDPIVNIEEISGTYSESTSSLIQENNVRWSSLLVKKDLSFRDVDGNTPILLACLSQCYESARLLLSNDSNASTSINYPNKNDETAFSVATHLNDSGMRNILLMYGDDSAIPSTLMIDSIASSRFINLPSASTYDSAIHGLFSNKFVYLCLDHVYSLSDLSSVTLMNYCQQSQDKQTLLDRMKVSFTDLCAEPSYKIILIRGYLSFIVKIITIKYYNLITVVYNYIYGLTQSDETPSWITLALNDAGKPQSWIDKNSILSNIISELKDNISEANYLASDLVNNQSVCLIPVPLWDIDQAIENNYDYCLRIAYEQMPSLKNEVRSYAIMNKVVAGQMRIYEVYSWLPTVQEAITHQSQQYYDYLNFLYLNTSYIDHQAWLDISNAVSLGTLDSSKLVDWPWQDPGV